jgi:protease-4
MLIRLTIILAFLLTVPIVRGEAATRPSERSIVAVFDLSGEIGERPAEDSLFGSPPPSLRDLVTRIDKAAGDPDVKAVVIMADDASFGQAQAAELRQAIHDVRAAGKEVYGHGDGLDMSQYELLSGASRLSVAPTGEVWAMGFHSDQPYLHGLLLKLGIQPDFLHCGAYKSASEMLMREGPSPEAEEMENWLLDSIYDTAVKLIASGRTVSSDQVRNWIDSGPYAAEKAREIGMIDAVEDRQELELLLKDRYGSDVDIERRYGVAEQPKLNLSNPFAMMGQIAELLNPPKQSSKPTVAVVYVDGMIVTGKGDGSSGMVQTAYGTDIARALDDAAADDSIKAVVLRVDSPGGSATASEIILKATDRVKVKKPFVVSMGDVAGSGGYYVTCAADTVFADDATITASVGVVSGKLVTTGMWDKIGITWKAYQRGAEAGFLAGDTDFTPEQKQRMQDFMDGIYGVFKNHVTTIRGNKLKKPIDDLAAGRVFTGRQALELGMVDRMGTLKDAIAFAADQAHVTDYDVRTVPEPKNFLQRLMEQSSGQDDEAGHVAMGMQTDWLTKLAAPYLQGLDPQHLNVVETALRQLELMQREQVVLMMPAEFCVRPTIDSAAR